MFEGMEPPFNNGARKAQIITLILIFIIGLLIGLFI